MDRITRAFVDLCRELFRLEEEYGYTSSEPSTRHVETTWRLRKGDQEIILMIEAVETFSIPTFLIRPPDRRESFGLHEALPALDPHHDAKRPKGVSYSMNFDQLRALMEHWAEFFHAHAEDLLDHQSKTFAAVTHFRKTKPDPYP